MATYVSPGVYVTEKDWSDYTPSLNSTTVGVAGFASQGPVGQPTLCTTQDQLLSTFGEPDTAVGGYGLLGSYYILERTNTLYFTRAALTTAQRAFSEVAIGTQPYVGMHGLDSEKHYTFGIRVRDGQGNQVTSDPIWISAKAASDSDDLATPGSTAEAIADAVALVTSPGSPLGVDYSDGNLSALNFVGSYAGAGAALEVRCWEWTQQTSVPPGTTFEGVTALSSVYACFSSASGYGDGTTEVKMGINNGYEAPVAVQPSVTSFRGASTSVSMDANKEDGGSYLNMSLYPGAGYNFSSLVTAYGVRTEGLQVSINSQQGADQSFNLLRQGGVEESYIVNLVDNTTVGANGRNPEGIVNSTTDPDNKTSDYLWAIFGYNVSAVPRLLAADLSWSLPPMWGSSPQANGLSTMSVILPDGTAVATTVESVKYLKLVDGVYNFGYGRNGDMAGGKSFSDSDVRAAIMGTAAEQDGLQSFLRDDVDVNMVAVPGCTDETIQNDLLTNAETSQKFLGVINPPYGLNGAQQAIAWSNGKASGRRSSLNSSYGAVYWPWVKLFNPFKQLDEYISPDIFAIRQMAYTDTVGEPWFAPAGLVRGRLTRPIDVEMTLSQGDRDALYGAGNCINPIQKFTTDGIVIWGQRTAQRTPTSLDRVNVRRLMILVRKTILASARRFVFEPNDPATWTRVVNSVEPFLADIQNRRGITKFKVICDESTNTPLRIDRNELWCKVIIQPTKTAEILIFELNLTSATLGTDVPNA